MHHLTPILLYLLVKLPSQDVISPPNRDRLALSCSALEKVVGNILNGTLNMKEFTELNADCEAILDLCEISKTLSGQLKEIKDAFLKRQVEYDTYFQFKKLFSTFWQSSRAHVEGEAVRHNKLKQESLIIDSTTLPYSLFKILKG